MTEDTENDSDDPGPKEKASGKEDPLQLELEKCREEVKGYYAQLQRTMADFENYKKRIAQDREELVRCSNEKLLAELIEPLENLDRALDASQRSRSLRTIRHGLEMTREGIWEVLGRYGLQRMKTVGERFDPYRHEAVEQIENEGLPEGHVAEEVRCGYMLGPKVFKFAQVKVVKKQEGGMKND